MPIPIIIGTVAAAAGIYGIVKGVGGAKDHSNAKDINESAQSMIDEIGAQIESSREATNKTIEDYGQRKLRAFNGVINEFIVTFSRLQNVELTHSSELEKLNASDFAHTTLSDLKQNYQMLKEAGLGLGAGMGSGAALAFGAYNGTMLLATASTGTAISSLTGVAATNATLAWLGGGSLATGGFGMAGGMMVLGGIVAGPALAIFGHILGNKGEEALNNALSNLEQAKSAHAEGVLIVGKLQTIETITSLANKAFSLISARLRGAVHDMKHALDSYGENYRNFPQESKDAVYMAANYAKLLKIMIDTPILDQEGNLVLSTERRIIDIATVAEGKKAKLDDIDA
ncbi:hypothetical protein [Dickeya oryzae]|uniref:Chemotaxis protein n=1 Tax=Dickeya oryzae TaxID=1240404 RepID=A0AB39IMI1_9GAMM|nr:hypothetical protein [Dickeya oryzae]MBP2850145.1 hypothetical protein [Dickeya oryzae]MBP2859099.1 hypothetical protein [Dickeya oryzae]MCA6993043.1 hypothetical protein [Dickeya oryzae]